MVNSFEMMSAEQAIEKINKNKMGFDAGIIQRDEINLHILSELTRWNMNTLQRMKLLRDKKPEMTWQTMFCGITLEVWKRLTEEDWKVKCIDAGRFQLSFPENVKSEDLYQGDIITPQAVLKQIHYLLEEPIDIVKEALDFCLLYTFKNLRFRISPEIPISIAYFPNLLTPAFPRLIELGWKVKVMDTNDGIELSFPSDLINTF